MKDQVLGGALPQAGNHPQGVLLAVRAVHDIEPQRAVLVTGLAPESHHLAREIGAEIGPDEAELPGSVLPEDAVGAANL